MSPPICKHRKQYPENARWPDEAAVEHFLVCMSPQEQLVLWSSVRHISDQGSVCIMGGHQERIEELTQLAVRLILGIRQAVKQLETVLDGDGHRPGSPAALALARDLRKLIKWEA